MFNDQYSIGSSFNIAQRVLHIAHFFFSSLFNIQMPLR